MTSLHFFYITLMHIILLTRTVANTVRPGPDVVITVWVCSWWWMGVSSETCRAAWRNIIKSVYSRILLDSYWHWFTMHGSMNTKFYWRSYSVAELCVIIYGIYIPPNNNIISCGPLSNTKEVKVKVQFSLRSIKHHALKTYGVAVHLHAFSASALDWRRCNVTRW